MRNSDTPKMTWRKCECPLNDTQDGVCGCPQFWERKVSRVQVQSDTESNTEEDSTQLRSSSTTPPWPAREICFFWYHGTCRRGDQCKLAHEFYITWPISPPPGFIHYTPCTLPLCPLRQDLVIFKESEMRKRGKPSPQLGGQLDGTTCSRPSRSTPVEVTSSNDESTNTAKHTHNPGEYGRKEIMTSLLDANSRALSGPYSPYSDLGNKTDGEEAASEVTAELQEYVTEPHDTRDGASSSSSHDSMEYFDTSGFAPLPPSSDTDQTTLLSLSHPGTLGKRERSTSPNERDNNKRAKREPTPDLDDSMSILKRKRPVNHWDQMPLDESDCRSMSAKSSAKYSHSLQSNLEMVTTNNISTQDLHSAPLNPRSFAPIGTRALSSEKLVCFYWYHKSHCIPRRKQGRTLHCKYAHNLDIPQPEVSLPPGVTNHSPDCPLPLCPVRLVESKQHDSKMHMRVMTEPPIKNEIITPPRRGAVHNGYSSSPRDSISEARCFVKGPKFNGNRSSQQLPKLTGANRERFKMQKRSIEQWQADNGVKPFDRNRMLGEKIELKKLKKQLKREKGLMKRSAQGPVLDYGKDTSQNTNPNSIAVTPRQWPKKPRQELVREATSVSNADIWTPPDKMEDRPQQVGDAIDLAPPLKDRVNPSNRRPSSMVQDTVDEAEHPKRIKNNDTGTGYKNQVNREPRIVVDYELPGGDARLDWVTK